MVPNSSRSWTFEKSPPFARFCSFYAKVWYLLKAHYYCIKCKKPPKDMARNDVRIIIFIKHKDKDIICIHVFMTTLKKRCTIENREYCRALPTCLENTMQGRRKSQKSGEVPVPISPAMCLPARLF